jgi:GNAT superfamily N-acetyltransferase
LASIDPQTSVVYHGAGIVVHPDFQRLGIGTRLLQLRSQQLSERRVDHCFGLTAVDNLRSIASQLRAGCLLAGFARDQTAMNYVVYWSRHLQGLTTDAAPALVPVTERRLQRRLFQQRHVICGLSQTAREPNVPCAGANHQFEFLPFNPPRADKTGSN